MSYSPITCPTILNKKICNARMEEIDINARYIEYACPRGKCGTRIAVSTVLQAEEDKIARYDARYDAKHPRFWK
jgi:hypothetical protein